jgi:hypothetical protein
MPVDGQLLVSMLAVVLLACSERQGVDLPPSPRFTESAKDQRLARIARPVGKILDLTSKRKAAECEVHGQRLIQTLVPIEYGLVMHEPEYLLGLRAIFPNATMVVGGGCIAGEETHARVKYCPQCRIAKLAWMAAHPGLRELGDRDPTGE